MNQHAPKRATVNAVQKRLATMRPGLSKGADVMLANPAVVAILSSAEFATRCDVPATSQVRLARLLGLTGLREMQAVMQSDRASAMDWPETKRATITPRSGIQDSAGLWKTKGWQARPCLSGRN